jgi:serine/threonine-protein kinase
VVEGYPPELEAIVLRALAVKPENRFGSARDLLMAIETFAAKESIALSQAALAAYLNSVFGDKPEAWRLLDVDENQTVDKTVTLCVGSESQFLRNSLPLPPSEASEVYDSVPAMPALADPASGSQVTAPPLSDAPPQPPSTSTSNSMPTPAPTPEGMPATSRLTLRRLLLYAGTIGAAIAVGLVATYSLVLTAKSEPPIQLLVVEEAEPSRNEETVQLQEPATEAPNPGVLEFDNEHDVTTAVIDDDGHREARSDKRGEEADLITDMQTVVKDTPTKSNRGVRTPPKRKTPVRIKKSTQKGLEDIFGNK